MGIFARVVAAAVSDGKCPLRRRCAEEYLAGIPQGKYISVDVPLDILELDKVMAVAELKAVVQYLNETRKRRVRLRVPWWAAYDEVTEIDHGIVVKRKRYLRWLGWLIDPFRAE